MNFMANIVFSLVSTETKKESQPKKEEIFSGDVKFVVTVVIGLTIILALVYFVPRVRKLSIKVLNKCS